MFLMICVINALVGLSTSQHHLRARPGPWRNRIQWENNGRLYSLLSTGSQYRSPAQNRRRTQLLLTTRNGVNRLQSPVAHGRSISAGDFEDAAGVQSQHNYLSQMDASVLGSDAGSYLLASGRPGTYSQSTRDTVAARYRLHQASPNGSSEPAFTGIQEFSGSGVPRGGRSTPGYSVQPSTASPLRSSDFTHSRGGWIRPETSDPFTRSTATSRWGTVAEEGGNVRRPPLQTSLGFARSAHRAPSPDPDVTPTPLSGNSVEIHFPRQRQDTIRTVDRSDPRDPHSIHHRNSVFYNVYQPDRRNRIPARPPPAPGYGTRFFYNGTTDRGH